jgi:NAD(P)-dependent dehydrogenase (short-subunit alcohol dehydrogenase family)
LIQALDNATDTLRNEVYRFGIPVSLISPGSVETSGQFEISESEKTVHVLTPAQHELYHALVKTASVVEKESQRNGRSATVTTRAINDALFSPVPRPRYLVGMDAKFTGWMKWVMSDRFLDWSYQSIVQRFEKSD